MTRVKISAASARLQFNGCDPDYIRRVCHARCCESSASGTMITIHASEEADITAAGGVVSDGLLQANARTKKCPFKTGDNMCGLHFTDHKPFGCIASPFTLNKNGTMILRNRYKSLKCYKDGARLPAYKAFRGSLDMLFGSEGAERICAHLDSGGGDLYADMPASHYAKLMDNDKVKRMIKSDALTFGQGLMRSEPAVGGVGKLSTNPGLTWVGGDRTSDELDETSRKILEAGQSGTSIFDPVLCELAYRWFCPPNGVILDPFAGGSVRGIVASVLGRQYIGVDLRAEQIDANRVQGDALCANPMPVWHVGDSREIGILCAGVQADFIFSCPPYADLEVYSDDPADLSTLKYPEFRQDYAAIISATCALLKPNRFACFVVGDVRDKRGMYYGFPWHTIEAFQSAGLQLYNEAVLVTAVASLSLRAGYPFVSARKLGKTHQNVLVFVKGDPKAATAAIGPVEFGDIITDDSEQ